MEKDNKLTVSLISGLIAVVLMTLTTNARADTTTPPPSSGEMEKCFGVVKAGRNDCDTNLGPGSCAPSIIDASPNDWVYLPVGVCEKLVGGTTTPGGTVTTTTTTTSTSSDDLGDSGATIDSAPIMKDDTILDGGAGLTSDKPTPGVLPGGGTELNKY